MTPSKLHLLVPLASLVLAACPPVEEGEDPPPPAGPQPVCTEPAASVACRDQTLVSLQMDAEAVADGIVETEEVDGIFHSFVDSTASGAFGPPSPFVYARFTDTGLEKVEITDDESFESLDWDISFRRFVIRLNSGVGGPSCVTAARTAPTTDFAALDAVPEGLDFNEEKFMSPDTCALVPDGSGDETFPGIVLQNYWNYEGCLQMTYNAYIVQRADGRHVKLVITHFYDDAAQQECNESATTPASPGSGNVQLDWAFLD